MDKNHHSSSFQNIDSTLFSYFTLKSGNERTLGNQNKKYVNVKIKFNYFANITFNTFAYCSFELLVNILSLVLYDLPVIFSTIE